MEKDAHYFWVGLFVVVAVISATGFIIWLMGTGGKTEDYARYTVAFADSVTGLEEGSNVLFKGVKVGKVIDLRLDGEKKDIVNVDIEIADTVPVRASSHASIALQGVTGIVHMEVTTNPKDEKPAERTDNSEYPVIKGDGSEWSKAMEDLPVITQQIREITGKLNGLMSTKAMKRVSSMLGGGDDEEEER